MGAVLFFLIKATPLLFRSRVIVFSHMTETLSSIIAPICYLLRIKHFLWYAHASVPFRLKFASLFVTNIITSTNGSCNLRSSKVIEIGQGVSIEDFRCNEKQFPKADVLKCIYVGRLDPSKNVDRVIEAFHLLPNDNKRLTIIGAPTAGNEWFQENLKNSYGKEISSGKITLLGNMSQKGVKENLCDSDLMIHAFQGSLDKVLIEAAISKTYVITCNWEFLREFNLSSIEDQRLNDGELLYKQLVAYTNYTFEQIQLIVNANYEIAIKNHSFNRWIRKLNCIIHE
jgi:glycosyltransferase involved in cell wall biosynthesis